MEIDHSGHVYETPSRLLLPFVTGFALAALLSYKNLDPSVDGSYNELTHFKKDGVDPTFNVSSRVVSVVVSNPSTQHLTRSVNITLRHLKVAQPLLQSCPNSVTYLL